MLAAPMAGGGDLAITYLRDAGEFVKEGDTVVQFDTTLQEFNLREADDDLAEAEQQVKKAEADSNATLEEARYAVLSAESDVKQAELEVRKNEVVAGVVAQQNDVALEAARNRLKQPEQDFENKKRTAAPSIAIQKAAVEKAKVVAQSAQRTIDNMVPKAKTPGYVNIQPNNNTNMFFYGQTLPPFQIGDTARAGMPVAQIPDMSTWEVVAKIPEADRGHLEPAKASLSWLLLSPGVSSKDTSKPSVAALVRHGTGVSNAESLSMKVHRSCVRV